MPSWLKASEGAIYREPVNWKAATMDSSATLLA